MELNYEDAMIIRLDEELPDYPEILPGYRRAPKRESELSESDMKLAISNALRYIHPKYHKQMAPSGRTDLRQADR